MAKLRIILMVFVGFMGGCDGLVMLFGADGFVSVRGYVVPTTDGEAAHLITCSDMPPEPKAVIAEYTVELWYPDADEDDRICSYSYGSMTDDRRFSLGGVVWYPRDMRYLLKVRAAGYRPYKTWVTCKRARPVHVIVKLAPVSGGRIRGKETPL